MGEIREYLLSVCCAAILCGVAGTIIGKNTSSAKLIKLLSGILLATVILKPLVQIRLSDWEHMERDLWKRSYVAVQDGERLARESFSEKAAYAAESLIKQEAEKLGCYLDVAVSWDGGSPKQVTLEGAVSPYAKNTLTKWIIENFGLSKEAQVWIG